VLELTELAIPERLDFLILLDGLRDPGNLGTILRCASAAGAQAVGITPGSVDAFSPKVLRAGMGAHFHLPVLELDWEMITQLVRQHHLQLFLAAAGQGKPFYEQDLTQPLALVIGGEAAGASQQAYRLAHTPLHIPMPGQAESLNAASAAAVLIFEVVRQRLLQ
jgi:TrmH family RNA methyltransferase